MTMFRLWTGIVATISVCLIAGCAGETADDKTTPIRPDLAQTQGAIWSWCQRGGLRASGDALAAARPLIDRYRYRPHAPFRYYGDVSETTAAREFEKLLAWMKPHCPERARLFKAAVSEPVSNDGPGRALVVDRPDRRWARAWASDACSTEAPDALSVDQVVKRFPKRLRTAARDGCEAARTSGS
jgi:hypothetical protein